MEISEAMEYIIFLYNKENDEKLFLRWIQSRAQYEMSFNDFKNMLIRDQIRDDEEIIEDVYELIRRWSK